MKTKLGKNASHTFGQTRIEGEGGSWRKFRHHAE